MLTSVSVNDPIIHNEAEVDGVPRRPCTVLLVHNFGVSPSVNNEAKPPSMFLRLTVLPSHSVSKDGGLISLLHSSFPPLFERDYLGPPWGQLLAALDLSSNPSWNMRPRRSYPFASR
jgi:hypothetical protein